MLTAKVRFDAVLLYLYCMQFLAISTIALVQQYLLQYLLVVLAALLLARVRTSRFMWFMVPMAAMAIGYVAVVLDTCSALHSILLVSEGGATYVLLTYASQYYNACRSTPLFGVKGMFMQIAHVILGSATVLSAIVLTRTHAGVVIAIIGVVVFLALIVTLAPDTWGYVPEVCIICVLVAFVAYLLFACQSREISLLGSICLTGSIATVVSVKELYRLSEQH